MARTDRPAFLRTLMSSSDDRPDGHPFDVPAIATPDTLSFAPVTVFVGDNGSGTSTLIEAGALLRAAVRQPGRSTTSGGPRWSTSSAAGRRGTSSADWSRRARSRSSIRR